MSHNLFIRVWSYPVSRTISFTCSKGDGNIIPHKIILPANTSLSGWGGGGAVKRRQGSYSQHCPLGEAIFITPECSRSLYLNSYEQVGVRCDQVCFSNFLKANIRIIQCAKCKRLFSITSNQEFCCDSRDLKIFSWRNLARLCPDRLNPE